MNRLFKTADPLDAFTDRTVLGRKNGQLSARGDAWCSRKCRGVWRSRNRGLAPTRCDCREPL